MSAGWGLGCVADPAATGPSLVRTTPDLSAPIPAGAPIAIHFAEYLDVDQLARAVELRSGDLSFAAQVGYDPVARAVLVLPDRGLRPHLGYQLTLPAHQIVGLDGAPLADDLVLDFVTVPGAVAPPAPPPTWAQIAPIFAERCGCHGPQGDYPTLSEAVLLSAESRRQPGVRLVEPGLPLRSHLVQRLLPDYPGVRGAQMPPDGPLADAELRAIIGWVEGR